MNEKPEYIYIMYPVPVKELANLSLPFINKEERPLQPTEEFVPLWFGNAAFPEDE